MELQTKHSHRLSPPPMLLHVAGVLMALLGLFDHVVSLPDPSQLIRPDSNLLRPHSPHVSGDCPPISRPLDPQLANTTSGLFQGVLQGPDYNITAFLSVPYAAPPLENLRFAGPRPFLPDPGAFDAAVVADKIPNACQQLPYRTLLESKRWPMPESEDCLTLSVWRSTSEEANNEAEQPLNPSLVFIHGGGFTEGGTTPRLGHALLHDHPDLIVVSINYRLNIFGFPNRSPDSSDTATPNAGLLDQRAALAWLHANIAAFGGDNERMVVMGHSAGSQSLGHYAYAYADEPLVSCMILWSGMPASSLQDRTGKGWQEALRRTNCAGDKDEVACLRDLDARELLRTGVSYSMSVSYDDFPTMAGHQECLVLTMSRTGMPCQEHMWRRPWLVKSLTSRSGFRRRRTKLTIQSCSTRARPGHTITVPAP
jgi:carboxylesterase type B